MADKDTATEKASEAQAALNDAAAAIGEAGAETSAVVDALEDAEARADAADEALEEITEAMLRDRLASLITEIRKEVETWQSAIKLEIEKLQQEIRELRTMVEAKPEAVTVTVATPEPNTPLTPLPSVEPEIKPAVTVTVEPASAQSADTPQEAPKPKRKFL